MTNLLEDARRIAKYLYSNQYLEPKRIKVAELRNKVGLSNYDFDMADNYLLDSKMCGGTMGGDAGFRWLTVTGVSFATETSKSHHVEVRTIKPRRVKAKRLLRVFLCHSSGDKSAVRDLYQRLRSVGYIAPWLDEEDLLPGQRWEDEIPSAVRDSDVVLVCLSCEAINRRGYVQKEIKVALDEADRQPEGTIFLIPAKLEECPIPERLNQLHYVNLFEAAGIDKLLRSLRVRADKLGINTRSRSRKLAKKKPLKNNISHNTDRVPASEFKIYGYHVRLKNCDRQKLTSFKQHVDASGSYLGSSFRDYGDGTADYFFSLSGPASIDYVLEGARKSGLEIEDILYKGESIMGK